MKYIKYLKYFYSDPSVVTSPTKDDYNAIEEVKFTMCNEDLSKLKKAAAVIGAPDMVLKKNGSWFISYCSDKKNDTANDYSLDCRN